jgi:hypothetical protein
MDLLAISLAQGIYCLLYIIFHLFCLCIICVIFFLSNTIQYCWVSFGLCLLLLKVNLEGILDVPLDILQKFLVIHTCIL